MNIKKTSGCVSWGGVCRDGPQVVIDVLLGSLQLSASQAGMQVYPRSRAGILVPTKSRHKETTVGMQNQDPETLQVAEVAIVNLTREDLGRDVVGARGAEEWYGGIQSSPAAKLRPPDRSTGDYLSRTLPPAIPRV